MAQAAWEEEIDGTCFGTFTGHSALLSLLVEQGTDGKFVASACPFDESEYMEIGEFDTLRLAKKALERYSVDVDCKTVRRR